MLHRLFMWIRVQQGKRLLRKLSNKVRELEREHDDALMPLELALLALNIRFNLMGVFGPIED